jgi:predicted membrane-bound spermidine synthase
VRVKKKPVQPAESGLPLGLRRYLYISAAITGAAIMIVEILGAKMLSPYFGTSHFVWTAQIAVTLVALACGYYAGGWLVDRSLKLGRLYAAILVAGIYLAVTVAVREPVAYACLKYRLASGSLLASTILFFVPLSLLAMVGPFVVRVLTSSVTNVGGNVGRLTALSTLGSFVGTVLIGYVLIPYLPNSVTMYLTALLLMLIAAVYLFGWGRASSNAIATGVALALGAAIGYQGTRNDRWQGTSAEELFRGNSNFGQLQVLQYTNSPRRLYLNDYLTQNTYDTNEHKSMSMFTYMLHGLAAPISLGSIACSASGWVSAWCR